MTIESDQTIVHAAETPKKKRSRKRPGEQLRVMIQLPVELVIRARVHAARNRTTVSRVIEDRLLELLAAK